MEKKEIKVYKDDMSFKDVVELTRTGKNKLNMDVPSIEMIGYTKQFGKFTAVKNASFSVGHGVIHGFIGPNGSGKTTCIKALIGAYLATSGDIHINGLEAGTEDANRLIGYIPERASFPKYLNTLEYLTAMGELSGIGSKEAKSKSLAILKMLGLEMHAKRNPTFFSSGMQKKILLAQSLLTDPSILILDEPAANLDPTARKELFDQLIELRNEGKTILISSHILSELERIVDEVTFVYYGEIIFSGNTDVFTNGKSDVYIKSDNNKLLVEKLKTLGYKPTGDIATEIEVQELERKEANELFEKLGKLKEISILSFRSNDLQSVYDKLVYEAEIKNRGLQELDGVKGIAMKKTSVSDIVETANEIDNTTSSEENKQSEQIDHTQIHQVETQFTDAYTSENSSFTVGESVDEEDIKKDLHELKEIDKLQKKTVKSRKTALTDEAKKDIDSSYSDKSHKKINKKNLKGDE